MYMFMYIQKYNAYIIYIYSFRQLNVYILKTSTYPMTICRLLRTHEIIKIKNLVACRLKTTRARVVARVLCVHFLRFPLILRKDS